MGVVSIQLPIKGVFILLFVLGKINNLMFQSNSLLREYLYFYIQNIKDLPSWFQSNSLLREYLYGCLKQPYKV